MSYFGKHKGICTSNRDPDLLGRIKAQVPSILGPNEETDWALPCVPSKHYFDIPSVGDGVWIEFEGGDIHYPIWVGTFWASGEIPSEAKTDYPANLVIQTTKDVIIRGASIDWQDNV
jgi:hypothetical protein